MTGSAQSNGEVPGWVILSPDALPDAWQERAIPMVLVPQSKTETSELLSGAPVAQEIAAADLPLVHLVARGRSTAEISRALHISPRTVNRHVARLKDEFGVSSVQELATELARRGF